MSHWHTLHVRGWDSIHHSATSRQMQVTIRRRSNAPAEKRLSIREFQIAYLTSLGLSTKQVAHDLQLSDVRVRSILSAALKKLGLRGCVRLPAFWYVLERTVTCETLGGGIEVLAFESAYEVCSAPTPLTDAERGVLLDIIAGDRNREVAEKRSTSWRTVANQVASLLGKFEAGSRTELAAKALGRKRASEHCDWLTARHPAVTRTARIGERAKAANTS